MRIAFVLPAPTRVPSGGYSVVYRHAQGLAARGHQVRIIAPRRIAGSTGWLRAMAVRLRDRWQGVGAQAPYSAPAVTVCEPERLADVDLDDDAVIATGLQTVEQVQARSGHRGWWFVQGDETFVRANAGDAWALGLRMIPCSFWLADAIEKRGGRVMGVVPNAVDREEFRLDAPIPGRGDVVFALYHWHVTKGPDALIESYRRLRSEKPGARLVMFSARTPTHRIPDGVEVVVRPSLEALRTLYNEAAVFLHTSRKEGWALTPMEAAACGAAVVATASRGPAEYLESGRSMIECPIGDVDALVAGVLGLLDDPARREAQALAGLADVDRFSWDRSTDLLETLLTRADR